MGVIKLDFLGNPNIGLYAFATDTYCLLGRDYMEKYSEKLENALGVPVHPLTIGGTSLIGVFVNGSEEMLLVPKIIFEHEKKSLEKLNIPFTIIESTLTALGNTIFMMKDTALVSNEFSAFTKKRIRQAIDKKVVPGTIGGTGTVGSLAITNGKGILATDMIEPEEKDAIEDFSGLEVTEGTMNMQNSYVGSAIIANKKGCCIGSLSTGVEINEALHSLGFL